MLDMNYVHHELQRLCELVHKDMASKSLTGDEIEWTSRVETLLLYALFNLKPVGVNRYFTMVGIHLKFSNYLNREVTSKVIWDHLDSMYDMPALHESEIIPFPNEEIDFELPEDFNDLVKEKFGVPLHAPVDENETPKNGSSIKTVKKPSVSKLKQSSTPVSSKNTFATPASVKSSKNHSDSRPPSSETVKVKQESPFPSKVNKVKRSSSPFTAGKSAKSETPVKDEASDIPVSKKISKLESSNSLSAKKVSKSENNSSASKKSIKQEPNSNSVRQGKPETPDSANKKIKAEKDPPKKGRASTPIENPITKKSSKLDSKKVETDSKKSNDVSSSKPKADKNSSTSSKTSKTEENEPSGPRKSITKASAAVVDSSDKKRKRQKTEESSKKAAPPSKRRRT